MRHIFLPTGRRLLTIAAMDAEKEFGGSGRKLILSFLKLSLALEGSGVFSPKFQIFKAKKILFYMGREGGGGRGVTVMHQSVP